MQDCNFPVKLPNVRLPLGEAEFSLNRCEINAAGQANPKLSIKPGFLWRSCSASEMQQAFPDRQLYIGEESQVSYRKSIEYVDLYCCSYPGEMIDLTPDHVKLLLPLSKSKRLNFWCSDSMQTAYACRVGDHVIAVDPVRKENAEPTKRIKCIVRHKGPLSQSNDATYVGLSSVDPVDEDGMALQIITVEIPKHVSVRDLLQLNEQETYAHYVILCAVDWLAPEFDAGHMNSKFRINDRVVFQMAPHSWKRGLIKWLGILRGNDMAGVEFDNAIDGASTGFDGQNIFSGREQHCRVLSVLELELETDFDARLKARGGVNHANYGQAPMYQPQQLLNFDKRLDEARVMMESRGLQLGSHVCLSHLDARGVVMWFGYVPRHEDLIVGVGSDFENASPGHGVLDQSEVLAVYADAPRDIIIYTELGFVESLPDKNEKQPHQQSIDGAQFGPEENDSIPGLVPPLSANWEYLLGRSRGIQGHHNSCYLDSTLFAMFATVDAFDCVLDRDPNADDIEDFQQIQRCLREGIVNRMRSDKYVRADHVLKLRRHLDKLNVIPGMMTEEKDPEEFINLLLDHALHHEPFIKLSTGQGCHVLQLFLDRANLPFENDSPHAAVNTNQNHVADCETLLHLSMIQSGILFNEPPKCLILQMPRSGKSYKLFHRILPVLELDITRLLPDTARSCAICGTLATLECHQCFMKHDNGKDYTYCDSCFKTFFDHKKGASDHKGLVIDYSDEVRRQYANKLVESQTVMDLLAVVCIRTSHYVCFLRSEPNKWLFFDSMADREGGAFDNGYNIPEVKLVEGLEPWLDKLKLKNRGGELPGEHVTRLLEDCYLCFYGNPRVVSTSC